MSIKIKGKTVINDNRNAEFYNEVKINGGNDPRLIIGPEDGDYSDYYYSIRHANNRLEFGSHNSATGADNYNQVSMTDTGLLQARAGMWIEGSGNVLTVNGGTYIVGNTVQDGDIGLAAGHKLTGKIQNLDVVDGSSVRRGPNFPIFKRFLLGEDIEVTTHSSWVDVTGWQASVPYGGFEQGNWSYSGNGTVTAPVTGIYEFNAQLSFRGLDEDNAYLALKFRHDYAGLNNAVPKNQYLAAWDTNEMFVVGADHLGADEGGATLATECHQFTIRTYAKMDQGETMKLQYITNNLGDGSGDVHIDVENHTYGEIVDPNSGGSIAGPMCWWDGRLITEI